MNKLWIFAVALAAIGAASAAAWGGPHHHRPPPHHHWPDHDSSEDSDSEWDSESMSRPWSNSDSSERSDSSSCEDSHHHHHHHHPWGYPDPHGPSQPWHGPPPPPHGPHGHGPPPPPPHGPHGHGPPPPHHHGPPPPPPPHHHHGPPPPPPPPPHHHHGPPPPPPGPYPPPNSNQPRPPGPFREPNPPQPGPNQFPRPNQPRPNQPGPNQPRPSQPTPNQPGPFPGPNPFPPQPNPSQPQPNQASRQACINGCPVTSEFNPVCGTDGVTYNNAGRLECARLCGVDVQLSRNSRCDIDGESTSARPTSPPPRPDVQACISRCPVTPEYNPVCGSDGVTYSNPGRLECSKQCGVNVQLTRNSRCPVNQPATSSPITNPTGIPSATPWPLPSSSTGVSISKDLLEEIFTTEADTTGLIDVRNNVE